MTPGERAVWAAAYGAAWVARHDTCATMWDDEIIAAIAAAAADRAVESLNAIANHEGDMQEIAKEIIG